MQVLKCLFVIGISFLLIPGCSTTQKKLFQQTQQGGYKTITISELTTLINTGADILIVDTLPHKNYTNGHIPGARSFTFPNPEMLEWDIKKTNQKSTADFLSFLGTNKDKLLIFYCWDTK